jgi:hypothetical protein
MGCRNFLTLSVHGAWWYEPGLWQNFILDPPGSASPTGGIAAVSHNDQSMEVWCVDSQGSIEGHWWSSGKTSWIAPPGSAALNSRVRAHSKYEDTMEIFWIGPAGSVEGVFWYTGKNWTRWQPAPPGSAVPSGLTAVSRSTQRQKIWWTGPSTGQSILEPATMKLRDKRKELIFIKLLERTELDEQ